eukprot:620799-Rhodomonas_salina.5
MSSSRPKAANSAWSCFSVGASAGMFFAAVASPPPCAGPHSECRIQLISQTGKGSPERFFSREKQQQLRQLQIWVCPLRPKLWQVSPLLLLSRPMLRVPLSLLGKATWHQRVLGISHPTKPMQRHNLLDAIEIAYSESSSTLRAANIQLFQPGLIRILRPSDSVQRSQHANRHSTKQVIPTGLLVTHWNISYLRLWRAS